MSQLDLELNKLGKFSGGKLAQRLYYELRYARRVSEAQNGKHDALVLSALEKVSSLLSAEGSITDKRVKEIEKLLSPMQEDCKKYKLMLCGHAHIDMNWMWRYDETVQITLDTFRTVLNLMKEFPKFTFSQSQTSVYAICEEFDPDMFAEIKKRIKEGRWEVTASTYVEADRNMANAESVVRQQLYSREFFEKRGITPSVIDFEPDTFGHNQNVPELLTQAGVKYYYHCRGLEGHDLYKYRAPSGSEILCYREPFWYNYDVNGDLVSYAPLFCEKYGVEYALRVYGVGDHGGGPTRRDLTRLTEMQKWPIFPTLEFGSFKKFFDSCAKATKALPVVDHELNILFPGCYTTQSGIKKGNAYSERLMAESEQLSAFAGNTRKDKMREGWTKVLFNQFHDILPGSGVPGTRDRALGEYQQAYAIANSAKRNAMRKIADNIDTSFIALDPIDDSSATGAGVGFNAERRITTAHVEVGQGGTRIFHVFNQCAFDRRENVRLTVWDLKLDNKKLTVTDAGGKALDYQLLTSGYNSYWGHDYVELMVFMTVPAMGFGSCILKTETSDSDPIDFITYEHTEPERDYSISNGIVSAKILPEKDFAILVSDGRKDYELKFVSLLENAERGMTAWVTGDDLTVIRPKGVRVQRIAKGSLYNALKVTTELTDASELVCTLSVGKDSKRIDLSCDCRWLEAGDPVAKKIPQLRLEAVPVDGKAISSYICDIPMGMIARKPSTREMPALRFISDGSALLMTDSKYGYRGDGKGMGVTLLRSAYDPDNFPELGNHSFEIGFEFAAGDNYRLAESAQLFRFTPEVITDTPHKGNLPMDYSFARVLEGSFELTAVKTSEDGKGLILRGSEVNGKDSTVKIKVNGAVKAVLCSSMEDELSEIEVSDSVLTFSAKHNSLVTVKVFF